MNPRSRKLAGEERAPKANRKSSVQSVSYSRGASKFSNCPDQLTVDSFDAFRDAVLSDRSNGKGEAYICGPCLPAPDDAAHAAKKRDGTHGSVVGQPYRSATTAGSRRFVALDIDYMRDAGAQAALESWMQARNAFGYTTHSHKADAPRMRWIVETDREMTRPECVRVTAALRGRIVTDLGAPLFTKEDGNDGIDASLDRPEQPIYTPGMRAETFVCHGEPLAVADWLAMRVASPAPKVGQLVPRAAAVSMAASSDEEVLARARDDSTGEAFDLLIAGRWGDARNAEGMPYKSQSEADMAVLGMLWNATGDRGDRGQVERLFRESPMFRPGNDGERKLALALAKVSATPPKVYRIEYEAASKTSDKANALRIALHLGDRLAYVPGIGYMAWDGNRWDVGEDSGLPARGLVTQHLDRIVRAEAVQLAEQEQALRVPEKEQASRKLFAFAGQSGDVKRIESAMKLAQPLLFVPAMKLDADPLSLGCANGVVDLRTGKLSPPDPAQYITKSTGVEFDPDAKAPKWERFLQRIFRTHPDLIPYLQQLSGWWLTGLTDPAMLAVLWGDGSNGKSTFVDALIGAMGDYGDVSKRGFLLQSRNEAHPTELADLQGKRFIVSAESSEDGRLDEEKVKTLTGGDRVKGRRMRQDFFSFKATHKLALITNHKPTISGRSYGIWRRVKLIPFIEQISEAEADTTLKMKLKAEAPGILAWAVRGAVAVLKTDYKPDTPAVVVEATKEYKSENDAIGDFINECCELGAKYSVEASALYGRYKVWAEDGGERTVTKKKLGMTLAERNFSSFAVGRNKHTTWRGLRLATESTMPKAASKALAKGQKK